VNIGDRIRVARKAAGLSQEEVARRAGLSLKGMGEIERGDIEDPHISSLTKIARALGVPVEALVKEEEVPALAGKAEAPPPSGPESEYNKEDRLEILRRMEMAVLAIVQRSRLDLETIDTGATDRKATADQLISVAGQTFWSYMGARQHIDEDEIVQEAIERTPEERRAALGVYAALNELSKTFDDINSVVDSFAAPAGASAGREGATITYIEERLRERAS